MGAYVGKFLKGAENIPETMLHIFPDAMFWGIGFIAFITLSYTFGMFFLSLVEGIAFFNMIYFLNQQLQIIDITPKGGDGVKCRAGFSDVSLQSVSMFNSGDKPSFPSSHIYITAFIASYLMSALVYYKDELEIMSGAYKEGDFQTRLYVSTIGFVGILFAVMSYRLIYNCDSATNIMVSVVIGLLAGSLVALQNKQLFGRESLNLLGIPTLRKRTAAGNDLFVCSPPT